MRGWRTIKNKEKCSGSLDGTAPSSNTVPEVDAGDVSTPPPAEATETPSLPLLPVVIQLLGETAG
jgi:hypothetical protein